MGKKSKSKKGAALIKKNEVKKVAEEVKAVAEVAALEVKEEAEKIEEAVETKSVDTKELTDLKKTVTKKTQQIAQKKPGRPKMTEKQKADAKKAKDEAKAVAEVAALKAKDDAEKLKEEVEDAEAVAKASAKQARKKIAEKVESDKSAIFIQFRGIETTADELAERAKAAFKAEHKRTAIEQIKVYVKPEDNAMYYVVNDKFMGKVDF